MKNGKKNLLFLILITLNLFCWTKTRAQTCTNEADCAKLIQEYTNQINLLKNQSLTLKNQIAQFDAQIKLTSIKVSQTQTQIDLLSGRLNQLGISLNDLTKAFSSRAIETYRLSKFENNFFFLFSSADIGEAVARFHYLQKIQEEDRNLLKRLQEAQISYQSQKNEQQTLQTQLQDQQKSLTIQKSAKAKLLKDTQNNESKYQQLLSEARAEYLAIQNIIAGNGQETEVSHVNQGTKIASVIQGSSCNSGGTHLHFTVSQNGAVQNPFNYLKNGIGYENCSGSSCGSGDGDAFNPSGSWDWPMNPSIKFNQGYGSTWATKNTYVSRIYSFHNGIDISSGSLDVITPKSGTLYRGSYSGSGGCSLRYVKVHNDDDGLDVYYLHVNYVL